MSHRFHLLVINGPNLNLLGCREPEKYGHTTLSDLIKELEILAHNLGVEFSHLQSNAEYEIVDRIHQAQRNIDFILINPAAFTHTSIAIRDALLAVSIPFIELHISNVYTREPFRHYSYISDIAVGVICGLGIDGYLLAFQAAIKLLSTRR